jgi:hypothetical protein
MEALRGRGRRICACEESQKYVLIPNDSPYSICTFFLLYTKVRTSRVASSLYCYPRDRRENISYRKFRMSHVCKFRILSCRLFRQSHSMSLTFATEKQVAVAAVRRACWLTSSVFNRLVKNETITKNDKSPVTGISSFTYCTANSNVPQLEITPPKR